MAAKTAQTKIAKKAALAKKVVIVLYPAGGCSRDWEAVYEGTNPHNSGEPLFDGSYDQVYDWAAAQPNVEIKTDRTYCDSFIHEDDQDEQRGCY